MNLFYVWLSSYLIAIALATVIGFVAGRRLPQKRHWSDWIVIVFAFGAMIFAMFLSSGIQPIIVQRP